MPEKMIGGLFLATMALYFAAFAFAASACDGKLVLGVIWYECIGSEK